MLSAQIEILNSIQLNKCKTAPVSLVQLYQTCIRGAQSTIFSEKPVFCSSAFFNRKFATYDKRKNFLHVIDGGDVMSNIFHIWELLP